MSENQFLEIIDGKIDVLKNLVEQQSKSGMFFDGFTKQVLEKINNKLDNIAGMETNELITYLSKDIKNTFEQRQLVVQERLDGMQGQIGAIQSNLVDSLKSPEIAAIFTKLSDTILDFSRNLNSQTKYFNSTIEDIQKEIAKNNVDEKFVEQTNSIRMDIERYKIDVATVVDSINSNFASMRELLEANKPSEAYAALAMDISLLQKGLNDVLSVVAVVEDKQTDFVVAIRDIASSISVEEIKLGVSSIFAQLQTFSDIVKYLVSKSDIEIINEKIVNAVDSIADFRDVSLANDTENKALFKKYFDELYVELSSLISKEEIEVIKNKLEYIQSKIVSGDESILEEIKNFTTTINSLFTKENARELMDCIVSGINNLSNKVEENISKSIANTEEQINSLKEILHNIDKVLDNVSLKIPADNTDELKKDISEIRTSLSEVLNKNSEEIVSSVFDVKESLKDSVLSLVDKIEHLETFSNFIQEKSDEQKSYILELKDYLQKLVTIISPISVELNLKNEEIKQVINTVNSKIQEKTEEITAGFFTLSEKVDSTFVQQEDLIKDVYKEIAQVNESTQQSINVVENLNNAIEDVDKKITEMYGTKDSITEQVSDVVSHQENLIRELETKVLLVADSTVENIKVVDEMNASVSNLDKKIGELSDVCSNVTTQINEVCDKQSNIVETFESKVAIVTNSIVEKAQEELDEKLNLITNTCGLINSQIEEVASSCDASVKNVEAKIVLATDNLVENNKIISSFDVALNKIDEKLETSESQRKSAKEDILSKINEVMTSLGEKLAQSFVQRKETKEEILEAVKVVNDDINEKITTATTKVDTLVDDITQLLGTSFANISEKLSLENSKNDEFKENLKLELEKTISEIINKLLKADEENVSTREQLVDTLNSAIETIKSKNKEQFDELDIKLAQSQEEIAKQVVEEINIEDLKINISEDLALYSVSLKEKIEGLVELITTNKDAFEKISSDNSTSLLDKLVEIKDEIDELKLSNASSLIVTEVRRVGEKIEGWSNDILDSISDEMKDACSDNIKTISDAIQDGLSFVKDDIQELVIRLTNVNNLAEDVKTAVGASFETFVDDCFIKLDDIKEEVKTHIDLSSDKITTTIQEYQKELKNLSDVDLNLYKEETKQFIQEQINELKESLDEIKSKVDAQDLDSLSESKDVDAVGESINSATDSINKRLELLRDIILSEIPSSEIITDGFEEVQESLSELSEKTDKLAVMQTILNEINVKADSFSNVVKTENASLKDIIEKYQEGISAISNIEIATPTSSDTKEFIKEELNKLKEQFIRNLTSVFENISFIEESEEIQNAIWDNADVIRKEITQLKQDLSTINAPSSSISDIDKKFDKLKSILESITTGDVAGSDKYIYTLPDVEMDIAKMRMAISEVSDLIKQNREDGFDVADRLNTIDDIKDDISSISKRTNKLILTSDDSNKFLRENIDDFKKILTAITKKCNKIDSTQLNQHIVDVKSLVMSGLKSDKILNEAFMHLAQWIDDTAKTMNTISSQVEVNKYTLSAIKTDFEKMDSKIESKTDEIVQIKESISELATKLDKKSDIDYSKSLYEIEYGLDRISEKMDVQEMKIKALEKKIEALSTSQGSNDETNSLLEFIASQVTAANENSRSNRLLVQKISMLEKQMARFETSISKITQFVDDTN